MDQKIQDHSPESPEIHELLTEQNLELWEPPFDRWLRLTDDLLRGWPHSATNPQNRRSEM